MKHLFTPPSFKADAFNCPHCNAYAHQIWKEYYKPEAIPAIESYKWEGLFVAVCARCHKYSIWHYNKMIYPDFLPVLPPNPDLNQDIQQDYKEAASILKKSPRGACALLRLALQKLMVQLGKSGKNLNDDIAKLVKEGLPQKIQRALDIVRVIGNNAVHPGQIDIRDDENTGYKLFELINLIAESMITRAKEIDKLYNSLPEDQRKAIEERDKKLK